MRIPAERVNVTGAGHEIRALEPPRCIRCGHRPATNLRTALCESCGDTVADIAQANRDERPEEEAEW